VFNCFPKPFKDIPAQLIVSRYGVVFFTEAAMLAKKQEKPISQIAADVGVNESVLRRWMQQAREAAQGGLPAFPGHGQPLDEELARLRKEVQALREANEILKKAAEL
jgi:transposase